MFLIAHVATRRHRFEYIIGFVEDFFFILLSQNVQTVLGNELFYKLCTIFVD